MESVLVVSSSEKGASFFSETLSAAPACQITAAASCGEARRLLLERDFDLVVVNAPLRDESGEDFARYVAGRELSQVILVVKSEFYEAISAACEEEGVLTLAKPLSKAVFWSAVSLAKAARSRIKRVQAENARLKQKIDDIRVVDRAKCLLISSMGMSEQEAHRAIEKQAMDRRSTRRAIAEEILKGSLP